MFFKVGKAAQRVQGGRQLQVPHPLSGASANPLFTQESARRALGAPTGLEAPPRPQGWNCRPRTHLGPGGNPGPAPQRPGLRWAGGGPGLGPSAAPEPAPFPAARPADRASASRPPRAHSPAALVPEDSASPAPGALPQLPVTPTAPPRRRHAGPTTADPGPGRRSARRFRIRPRRPAHKAGCPVRIQRLRHWMPISRILASDWILWEL